MQIATRKLIDNTLQIICIPAATCIGIGAASLIQHAGLVTLIIPGAIEASSFRYVLALLYTSLCIAAYLASSNKEGRPDYLLLAGVLSTMPLLNLVHDPVVQAISGASWGGTSALKVYLSICILLPFLLVPLCMSLRRSRPTPTDAHRPIGHRPSGFPPETAKAKAL